MAGKRTKDHHLPERVYFSRGWHFYVDPDTKKWHKLGKEWDKAARDKWVELSTGKAPVGTVADLLDRFMTWAEGEVRAGRRSQRTYDDNEDELVPLKKVFGRMQWNAVTPKHVARYLKLRTDPKGNPAPIRANREKALLSAAYSWAMGEPGFDIERNPCHGVRRNRETPRTHYVGTRDVVKYGKDCCPPWLRGYILLKRLTLMRQADMLRLGEWAFTEKGIDYQAGKGKTRGESRRNVRWTWALRIVVKYLRRLRDERAKELDLAVTPLALFITERGGQMTMHGFRSAWRRSINKWKAAGNEGFREHDIRAKSASDAPTEERAGQLLGDSAATTRRHYRRGTTNVMPLR